MAKQGCEYWSSLLWNDECYINLGDESLDEAVNGILKLNDFWEQTSRLLEKTFALGTGAFVAYNNKGK